MGRNNRRRSHRVKWVERSETKKRLGIHEALAPFTLALVLGNRAEDAFRLSMIGSAGNLRVFWSNGLVGSITTLALILLFWPLIGRVFENMGRRLRPRQAWATSCLDNVRADKSGAARDEYSHKRYGISLFTVRYVARRSSRDQRPPRPYQDECF
jgi:hypothetical protein